MNIFYYSNDVYQFSYVKPIYDRIGGTFLLPTLRKQLRFKRYLRNGSAFPEVKTVLNTPLVKKVDTKNMSGLRGIIISQTNTRFICPGGKSINIFMGHGTGDRKYGGSLRILENFDYHFITGPKHIEKLRDSSLRVPEERLIEIGNPRFDAYQNGTIQKERCLDYHKVVDRDRKNILYAPTWKRGKGTLFNFVFKFCRELTKEYNLIVRPHYYEAKYIALLKNWVRVQGIKHVYWSHPADILRKDTMMDFMISDLLISDTSSIQYEYLITEKPMIIAMSEKVDLHAMPENMNLREIADVYDGSRDSDIVELVKLNITEQRHLNKYKTLLGNCFYFNDGHSTDRAVEFLESLVFKMDIN